MSSTVRGEGGREGGRGKRKEIVSAMEGGRERRQGRGRSYGVMLEITASCSLSLFLLPFSPPIFINL